MPDEPETTGEKRESNSLTTAQAYRLCLWLDHNRDRLRKDRLTLEEVATEATDAMKSHGGFLVTWMNVKHAVKEETPCVP